MSEHLIYGDYQKTDNNIYFAEDNYSIGNRHCIPEITKSHKSPSRIHAIVSDSISVYQKQAKTKKLYSARDCEDDFFVSLTEVDSSTKESEKTITKTDLFIEILSFKTLQNNWDGHGAIPLEINAAANAINLIGYMATDELGKISEVFPNPNGTISFMWKNINGDTVSLEVGNNSMSYYFELKDKKPVFVNDVKINNIQALFLSSYIQEIYN